MRNINKITNIALISMLIGVVVCPSFTYSENISILRAPVNTEQTKKRIDKGMEQEGLVRGYLLRTDPGQFNPNEDWSFFTHGGVTDRENTEVLLELYNDLSKAGEKIFCCYSTSNNDLSLWRDFGFTLDASQAEVFYIDGTRYLWKIFYPLKLKGDVLERKKQILRVGKLANISLSYIVEHKPKTEVDFTGGNITGIFVNALYILRGLYSTSNNMPSFAILMAIAVKYRLPIVLLDSGKVNLKKYAQEVKEFRKTLLMFKLRMFDWFDTSGINLDKDTFIDSVLAQVRPQVNYAPTGNLEIVRPSAGVGL